MRVNVDRTGHHDFARRVVSRIGTAAGCRRSNDAHVSNPNIRYPIAAVYRIDDPAPADARQHAAALWAAGSPDPSADVIRAMACATDMAGLLRVAVTAQSAPRARLLSIPSWSTPGCPTVIHTRGGPRKPASGTVSAIIGTSRSQSGLAAR